MKKPPLAAHSSKNLSALAGLGFLGATACGGVPPEDARAPNNEERVWMEEAFRLTELVSPIVEAAIPFSGIPFDAGENFRTAGMSDPYLPGMADQLRAYDEAGRILIIEQESQAYQRILERARRRNPEGTAVGGLAYSSVPPDQDINSSDTDDYIIITDVIFPKDTFENRFSEVVEWSHLDETPIYHCEEKDSLFQFPQFATTFIHERLHHDEPDGHDPRIFNQEFWWDMVFETHDAPYAYGFLYFLFFEAVTNAQYQAEYLGFQERQLESLRSQGVLTPSETQRLEELVNHLRSNFEHEMNNGAFLWHHTDSNILVTRYGILQGTAERLLRDQHILEGITSEAREAGTRRFDEWQRELSESQTELEATREQEFTEPQESEEAYESSEPSSRRR